jgi:hypothetical protein
MLKATLKASISGTLAGVNDLGDPVQTFAEQFELAIANGAGTPVTYKIIIIGEA